MLDETKLRERYAKAGQEHVFQCIDQLGDSDRNDFLSQLNLINVESLDSFLTSAKQLEQESNDESSPIEPFKGLIGRSSDNDSLTQFYQQGMQVIRNGEVAALVLAGGQGTRLGYEGPKGMFDVGLPSGSTLFQIISERIKHISDIASKNLGSSDHAKQSVPFYIMTSPLNHDETVQFFKEKNYFGLGENNVFFFKQGMLPCIDENGKIILESAGMVSMAPDGNGGIYPALQVSGALNNMKHRGIKYLHVFSIDNALVKPADPIFIGYCVNHNADCGNKVVWKAHAHEKVGVVATKNNKPCIVEYSEISSEMAESVNDQGILLFGAANICNHFYTLDFIETRILGLGFSLYHIARKKIPYYDIKTNETITPTENNGIKLESFIFDVFPLSDRMAVMDVPRTEEFAPVKNHSGSDSPETARELISDLAKKYMSTVGANVIGTGISEISPLITYAGEGLEEYSGRDIICPFNIRSSAPA